MSPDASWKWYRDYATYEACADEGDALVGADIIITYECDWDSPSWGLMVYN
jgi:hypothetical protein